MRNFIRNILTLSVLALFSACNQAPPEQPAGPEPIVIKKAAEMPAPQPQETETQEAPYKVALGDMNGDGTIDTILVYAPKTRSDDDMACVDSTCTTYFSFVGNALPSFSHEMALGGVIGNAGDLDDNGTCEIYFVPDWFTSNWTGLNIYSLVNGKWKKIASRDIRREEGIVEDSLSLAYDKRIIKHNKQYFELVGNVMNDEGIESLVPKKYYFK